MKVSQIVKESSIGDPLQAYEKVRSKYTYLLESAEGGKKIAQYSIIGFDPAMVVRISEDEIDFRAFDPELEHISPEGNDPLEIMHNLMPEFEYGGEIPTRFCGGFAGYFSYDLIRYFINLDDKRDRTINDLKQPVCEFILAKHNIIFDHIGKKTYLITNIFSDRIKDEESKKMDDIENLLIKNLNPDNFSKNKQNKKIKFTSNLKKEEFERNVEIAKDYIVAGDIFQVVLSQRLGADFNGDAFEVYKKLKEINPSPYMYFLDFGNRKIAGSSIETLARVENRIAVTYPIAGTRPRGKTEKEDRDLELEMLSDEKERAEHIMLVDLGRNDIGRVAKFGSVRVTKFMGVEKYSHVQHIVSEVKGELRDDKNEFDALISIFPAGTVSGAPKVRAMEIINELEPMRRGIYAGGVGYFSFNHNMDTAIAIRTLVFEGNKVYAQAGAGIVADSIPEKEYEESMNKAKALLKAVEIA